MRRPCYCVLCAAGEDRRHWSIEPIDGGAYTVGLWHSFGSPEVVMFGQSGEQIFRWLGDVAEQVGAGRVLAPNQEPDDVLGDPVVHPRPVLASWHRHLVAEALTFYRGQPVPIVQLAWADARGRPPWQSDCDDQCRSAQPALWGRPDPALLEPPPGWPFPVSPDSLVNTTPAIAFSGSVPRLVVHDEDGEWEFLEDDMTGDLTLVHFAHVVAHHPDLSAVADLPPGWAARRGGAGTWQRLLWDDD